MKKLNKAQKEVIIAILADYEDTMFNHSESEAIKNILEYFKKKGLDK